jgi:DNA-binding XRE family transcriptional regulator
MSQIPRKTRLRSKTPGRTLAPSDTPSAPREPVRNRAHCVETEDEENVYLRHDGEPTHVVLPVDVYERLVKSEMALYAIAAEDDEREWVDADDLAIELAAESVMKARKAAGLTQTQLAKKLGVPQSQISRIERNPDRTTVRTLKRIAKALRVDVSALI